MLALMLKIMSPSENQPSESLNIKLMATQQVL